jgi:hypothetical protein
VKYGDEETEEFAVYFGGIIFGVCVAFIKEYIGREVKLVLS